MLAQATPDTAFVISLVVIVALVYLLILRLMDMNEKEPAWVLALALALGAGAAVLVDALIGVEDRTSFATSLAIALGMFVALAILVAMVSSYGRTRGVREFHGLVDGLVYGAAVGLGFAVGEVLLRELGAPSTVALAASRIDVLWSTVLAGLSDGLIGAVIGIGFGAAAATRSPGAAAGAVLAGLVAGILVEYGYALLAFGGEVGAQSVARSWIALLLPALLVIVVAVTALARERAAIRSELPAERDSGVVTDEDLRVLPSFGARRAAYSRLFFRGDFDAWLALRELHSRQVQLALAKRRAARHPNDPAYAEEIEGLRAAVARARLEAEARRGPSMFGRGEE
jgi:protease PrsW